MNIIRITWLKILIALTSLKRATTFRMVALRNVSEVRYDVIYHEWNSYPVKLKCINKIVNLFIQRNDSSKGYEITQRSLPTTSPNKQIPQI
jgi:hypothetical protein